jgi:hypothetical protein
MKIEAKTDKLKDSLIVERLLTPEELDHVSGACPGSDYCEIVWPPVSYAQQTSSAEK